MSEILILTGIEALSLFLCIYVAVRLSGDVTEEMTAGRKVVCGIACVGIVADHVTNSRILYFNNGIWFFGNIFLILLFVVAKCKHRFIRAGISILVNHILVYIDYALGFILVTYGGEHYSMMVVLHAERLEIKGLFLLIRIVLTVGTVLFLSRTNIKFPDLRRNRRVLVFLDIISYLTLLFFQRQFLSGVREVQIHYFFITLAMGMIFCSIFLIYDFTANQQEQELVMRTRNMLLEENYRNLYEEQKRLERAAHDFKNHINLLENYIREEKYDTAAAYIQGLKNPLKIISQRSWSGNKMIDTILNIKLSEAEEKEIRVYTEIECVQTLSLSEYDLCVVLSNLLDNAIEACEYVEVGKKELAVYMKWVNHLFIIKIVNSIGRMPDKKNGKYYTTKKDKRIHGIGLESVRVTIDKYQGTLFLEHTGQQFTAIVSIPYENE